MKEKSIKFSDYFKIVKPKYVYLKITPDISIRNYNSSNIVKALSHTYKTINKRIKLTYHKYKWVTAPIEIQIEQLHKLSYLIDIKKDDVSFYFIVSEYFENIAREKISEIWSRATIDKVDNIEEFSTAALKYELTYKREDALSLEIDKRTNEPLNSILSVLNIMKEKDRIGVFYNFMPTSQLGWRAEYKETIDKVNRKLPVNKNKKDKVYITMNILNYAMEFLDSILEVLCDFIGGERKKKDDLSFLELAAEMFDTKTTISSATRKKKDLHVLNTQMLVLSESEDATRKENNIISVCGAYKSVDGDNELIYRKVKEKKNNIFNIDDFKIASVEENKVSVEECQNFIQLPGRDLLEQYNFIEKKNTLETEVPQELQEGIMCIGENTVKDKTTKAYLSTDKSFQYLTLCLVGPTRAGKTTLISNLSKDSIEVQETTILFDFCGNCELSKDVSSVFAKDKILNIDCSDFNNLQGLGYNEIVPSSNNVFEVYRCAKTKTSQLMTLINSINNDDGDLKARMERYLEAASVVVFLSDGAIKDVFSVLQDHVIRHKYLEEIPSNQIENTEEYVRALKELDEKSKPTKDNPDIETIGTKLSFVQGILNRVNKLKQNTYMELMLKKDTSNNINLIEEIQKSQLICIRMPEIMFSTETEKDIYCTYWLTKIWGTLQVRKWLIDENKRIKTNIVIDELYQVPKCQDFLRSKLSQIAKFGAKPILSCHYLGQIGKIRNELKAANSSYMLISGCDKDNWKELKDELYPFQLEDLLNLKRHHSLNLIKYEKGWAKFITHLPPPIE